MDGNAARNSPGNLPFAYRQTENIFTQFRRSERKCGMCDDASMKHTYTQWRQYRAIDRRQFELGHNAEAPVSVCDSDVGHRQCLRTKSIQLILFS